MPDEVKHGTHRRISDENLERMKDIGRMGDSVNKLIGKLLDIVEDLDRCLEGEEPETEKLQKLKRKWTK
jgi:hypothetical protein